MDYTTTTSGSSDLLQNLIGLAVLVIVLASLWKIFTKAGKPGWAALIPIYNMIVLLQIVGRPIWWFVLLFIPLVGIVFSIILAHDTSKAFGRGIGTTLLLIFLPFIGYPILGFGSARYVRPNEAESVTQTATV